MHQIQGHPSALKQKQKQKQTLKDLRAQIDLNSDSGRLNTVLSLIDMSPRQKINKETSQ
jgi:hypothetical protein